MKRPFSLRPVCAALVGLPFLTACALTPDYERPSTAVPVAFDAVPSAAVTSRGEAVSATWWSRFGSVELDSLIERAMAANHDLAAAVARIDQARATVRSAQGARWPSLDVQASRNRTREGSGADRTYASSDVGDIGVSYELDLWGAQSAAATAARSRLDASAYDSGSVALVLQADVATRYFQILALRDRLTIARRNLEAAREVLSLIEVKYEAGAANALEVAQQRTATRSIESAIPELEQNASANRTALAVLLGVAPQGFDVAGQTLAVLAVPNVNPGQPSELLERRPDVRTVEASLLAANADIGIARAALFPSIGITATTAVSGALTGGSTAVASVAGSLAQSIFDGGQRRAGVDAAWAIKRELVQNYAQTVLVALKEVQDGLVNVATDDARAEILADVAEQAREAYRLAYVRYESGADDLLALLDSQRTQLDAEDGLVQAQLARYASSTELFKALGGGWSDRSSQ